MNTTPTATQESEVVPRRPAKVLQRWNSWVQVWFPDTHETTWVNLDQTGFEPAAGAGLDIHLG